GPVTSMRLYSIATAPAAAAAQDNPPTYRCTTDGGGNELASPSWSPDGADLAYQQGSDTYIVHVGDLSQGCSGLGQPHRVLTDAQGPAWGPADVGITAGHPTDLSPGSPADGGPAAGHGTTPGQSAADTTAPATRISIPARQRLSAALAKGLRVHIRLNEPAALRAGAAAGATVATAGRHAASGTTTPRPRV